ncbi:hypothetical protein OH77DRAFT_964035 [Trametes cingulata]|nr:hypothetical protein OH77DRAFT_964035 [Trametes cingulata]
MSRKALHHELLVECALLLARARGGTPPRFAPLSTLKLCSSAIERPSYCTQYFRAPYSRRWQAPALSPIRSESGGMPSSGIDLQRVR